MAVSTFRKLYANSLETQGSLAASCSKCQGPRGPVHVVVTETDYQSFAILYLEKARKLTVKLNSVYPTSRSLPVSDSVLNVFEQRVRGANLTEHQIFFFPKYGFCETSDQFHILNGLEMRPSGGEEKLWTVNGPRRVLSTLNMILGVSPVCPQKQPFTHLSCSGAFQ